MKSVNEVLGKIKGEKNVKEIVTGKGAFSKAGFKELTSALVNDKAYKTSTVGKDGKPVNVNISELIRADLKKTAEKAGFPQKSEKNVYDTVEISTSGIAEAIPFIVREQITSGKKFDIPATDKMVGSIYTASVKGKTRTSPVRDIKTKEDLGTVTITTKDSVQIRAKSPVPKKLQTKVRRDKSGKVIS